ncbi:MAG TPA: glycosyltransferase family 39 protein, partial [Alphaproteobacteria bacterium]|nr:glycosyltransferase family 39 protein [Alphaproteobacteria bacterium]
MRKLLSWLVPEGSAKLSSRVYLALALITLVVQLPGWFNLPAVDRDEARYAQATRQMFESHNFIDIKFADQDRFLQPIGIYWLQAAAALPFGGAHAPIWAFRIPSLLASLSIVLLVAWLGSRLFDSKTGLAAGLILAPALLLNAEAHLAKIDATLALATLITQIALWMSIAHTPDKKRRFIGWPLLFWVALGVGGLLKGPMILLIVGLTIIAYGIWQREWRYLIGLNPILGVIIVTAIIAPWLIAIEIDTHGAFLEHAVGHSFGYKIAHGEQSHGQPPGYHTLLFMATFFPGVVLAGLGGFYAWHTRSERLTRFLLSWILPTWIMFELVATKLPHYVLPVFPAIALLAGAGLKDASSQLAMSGGRWWHRAFGLLFIIAACALAVLPFVAANKIGEPVTPFVILASIFAGAVLVTGAFLWWKPSTERLLPLLAATALTYLALFQFAVPNFKRLWVSEEIADVAHELHGCAHISVATAGFTEPSAVFAFGSSTVLGDGKSAVHHLSTHPGCGLVVVAGSEQAAFEAELQAEGLQVQKFGEVQGFYYTKG